MEIELEFKRESVSVMRDFLLKSHRSVSAMKINSSDSAILYLYLEKSPPEKVSVCNQFGYYGKLRVAQTPCIREKVFGLARIDSLGRLIFYHYWC